MSAVWRPAGMPTHLEGRRWLWWLGLPLALCCAALAATQGAYAITLNDLPRLWAWWWRPATRCAWAT